MYRLTISQTDRMAFDAAVSQFAWDAANSLRHMGGLVKLTDELLNEYRQLFLDGIGVDDTEEAAARFDDAFRRAWAEELEEEETRC